MPLTLIEPRLAPLGNSFELFGALPRRPRRSRSFSGYFPVDLEDCYHFVDASPEPEVDSKTDASTPTSTSDGCSTSAMSSSSEPPSSSGDSEQGDIACEQDEPMPDTDDEYERTSRYHRDISRENILAQTFPTHHEVFSPAGSQDVSPGDLAAAGFFAQTSGCCLGTMPVSTTPSSSASFNQFQVSGVATSGAAADSVPAPSADSAGLLHLWMAHLYHGSSQVASARLSDATRLQSAILPAGEELAAMLVAKDDHLAQTQVTDVVQEPAPGTPSSARPSSAKKRSVKKPARQGSKSSQETEMPQPAGTTAQADALPSKITSLMLRNLPRKITQQDLVNQIHTSGFEGKCDFCYMPRNFNSGENQGHAFVNFVTEEAASDFHKAWHRHRPFRTNKNHPAINISAADLQGLSANLAKWDNPRMRRVRNPIYKPFLLEPADAEQQVDGATIQVQ